MFKVVFLLKRRPGMTVQEFKDYYENHHAKIGEEHLGGGAAVKYIRRYFEPITEGPRGTVPDTGQEPEFDGIMEMWFRDKAQYDSAMTRFSEPWLTKLVTEDEEKLFDRSKLRMYIVDEHESNLGRG